MGVFKPTVIPKKLEIAAVRVKHPPQMKPWNKGETGFFVDFFFSGDLDNF
ncbi:hypothetical protein GM3709_941 [Geminocystis sp. NIES-3709]|nr:hypothetical protein GM3709_941 [Geminocystis sp. NIES-3709]